jgi:hypothetical protein
MFASSYGQWKGKDATVALAKMSLEATDVNRTDCWHNLSLEEQESLASWTYYFHEKYWIRAKLREYNTV